ncbi:hypothetical protein AB0C96_30580 [Streptomyces sp. NPDC048506]|uniref:hypothetical protein n=1 Tax=Streptomyces sp. NPDC048506 TaxID=3155028 RepID=UPI003435EA1B
MADSDQTGNNPALPPTPPPLPPTPPQIEATDDSAPRPVPTTEGEALEIGRQHFPEVGSPGGPSALFVHEFDAGYLVYAGWPAPEDPTAPPSSPGGSNVAISKVNGDVTFLPNFPPAEAVELYHRFYRPSSPEQTEPQQTGPEQTGPEQTGPEPGSS